MSVNKESLREDSNESNSEEGVITLSDTELNDSDIEDIDEHNDDSVVEVYDEEIIDSFGDSNSENKCPEEDDIEIIQVKCYNEVIDIDSDIEVLSQILSPEEVIDCMHHNLRVVQQMTGLSLTTLRVVLSAYRWDKDKFGDEYWKYGLERILSTLKVVISREHFDYSGAKICKKRKLNKPSSSNANSGDDDCDETMVQCLICFDEANASQMYANNSCRHYLCIECWNNYIATKVNDNSSDDKIVCPSDGCGILIDDNRLIALINDERIRDKYQRMITNSFVTHNNRLRWCPNGSCLHAVKVKHSSYQDIECVCKTVFCFLCGEDWHEPLTCEMYKNWIQKYASFMVDENSAKWITKYTKCCPKCKFPIEKNGGCNYVLCAKCKHSFCYNCLGKCSHGRCIGRNADDSRLAQQQDLTLKQDLEIYPFYKEKYTSQSKKLKLERKLHDDVVQKLEKSVKSHEFKCALKFLKKAFSALCHCRQTLMYSYVFGYYLRSPKEQTASYTCNLIELEKQTENLSKILTRETTVIHKDDVSEMKRNVEQVYRNCEKSRSTLVAYIKNGLKNNIFQFMSTTSNNILVEQPTQEPPLDLRFNQFNQNLLGFIQRAVNTHWNA